MRYRIVLLDLDHTLLDSSASESAAFAETVRSIGKEPTPELFQCYSTINKALWAAVERGETTPVELKLARFEQFAAAIESKVAEPAAMAATFTNGLGNNGELYPEARAVLEQLNQMTTLGMITNGLSEVQRRRIERLDLAQYFDSVIISAEVGTSKPGTEIFDLAFAELNHRQRDDVLMVGDSLTSDIQGGINAGIDTCLYAPEHVTVQESNGGPVPTHQITALSELIPLVAGKLQTHRAGEAS